MRAVEIRVLFRYIVFRWGGLGIKEFRGRWDLVGGEREGFLELFFKWILLEV